MPLPLNAPVRYYGENAEVLEVDESSGLVRLRFDTNGLAGPREEWIDDPDCAHVCVYASLEQFAIVTPPGQKIPYSPFGYLVATDATVYTLRGRGLHGVIMAILYPEIAAKSGYRQPDTSPEAMHYTGFQIDFGHEIPLIRVSFGYLTAVGVDKGHAPAVPLQIDAARRALLAAGVKPGDKIACSATDLKMVELLDWLAEDHAPKAFSKDNHLLVASAPCDMGS